MCFYDKPCPEGCTGVVDPWQPWSKTTNHRPPRTGASRTEIRDLIKAAFGNANAEIYQSGSKIKREKGFDG